METGKDLHLYNITITSVLCEVGRRSDKWDETSATWDRES